MTVRMFTIIAALTILGCSSHRHGQNNLPVVSVMDLSPSPEKLRNFADNIYQSTRELPSLIKARSALLKANKKSPSYENLWRLARIAIVLARWDENRKQDWAAHGKLMASKAITAKNKGVEGHVYHAISAGLVAQDNPSQGRELANTVLKSAQTAVSLDPNFESGLARQVLGAVYVYAPPWPAGVGDMDEAIDTLEGLVKDFPQQPHNVFFMAEAYRKVGQREDAIRQYKAVLKFKRRGIWRLEGKHYRTQAKRHLRNLKK